MTAEPEGAGPLHSRLWGAAGEAWDPAGPLGDFSFAGYACGERPLPQPPVAADVRDFGARGDGRADDSAAFQRAIAATAAGAVLVPAGRYRIRERLCLDRPGLVLRGEGPERSVLLFDRTLTDVEPNWGATSTGERTSNYSWSGGFVSIRGDLGLRPGAAISAPARRGERSLQVAQLAGLAPGQWLGVEVQDDAARSLSAYLYGGDPGPLDQLPPLRSWQAARVAGLDAAAGRLTLDRPMRLDLRPAWRPRLLKLAPSVSGCGIEGLGFQFPDTPWMGEFTELGYNAIALEGVAHCWVRDVAIHNAEGGVFVDGLHCSLRDLVLTASKPSGTAETYGSPLGCRGHHGIEVHGGDHWVSGFDLRTRYVHDLTVDGPSTAGNVFSRGRGSDLCLDHHKKAAHANLFSGLDLGVGGRPWRSGGGAGLGRACGAWEAFWGLRAQRALDLPPPGWAGGGLVLVGGDVAPGALDGGWREAMPPGRLEPGDLHSAQVARRLGA